MVDISEQAMEAAQDATHGNIPPVMLERALTAAAPYMQGAAREQALEAHSDLLERLDRGVVQIGLHEDNDTELFDVETACETMSEAATAIRALSSPDHAEAGKVEGDGWLPIERAPKDGTQILIEVHPGIFDVVSWSDGAWRECGNFMRLRKDPTHWYPLPSAPSEGAE